MTSSPAVGQRLGRRALALMGLGGAVLSGIGDVLILGRPCSGSDFDQAAGLVPPHIEADKRWRSLWNGAGLTPHRVHVGTLTGLVGISILQWLGLRGIARRTGSGTLSRLATASATAFAVSGAMTHLCCGTVVLAYQRASTTEVEPAGGARPSPRSATGLLAASAVGTLGALAVFSGSQTVVALRGPHTSGPVVVGDAVPVCPGDAPDLRRASCARGGVRPSCLDQHRLVGVLCGPGRVARFVAASRYLT